MAVNTRNSIVTNGLVLALDAGNTKSYTGGSTTWRDISGNGRNGTLTNGPTFNSGNGGQIQFGPTSRYINIPSSVNVGNPNTICAFIKLSGSNADTVVYGSNANGVDNWLGISSNRPRIFATQTSNVNNFELLGTTTLDTTNTIWYFIASTISGSVATLYLNGVQENTTTQAFTIGSWDGSAAIGRRGSTDQRYLTGSVAYVMGYNRALSQQEILQNYNAGKTRFGL
jgi:hypothetical protein